MAKIIRFPLKMKDGTDVRTLEELREHFDLESVLSYFADGKLKTWLADRYYDEMAEKVAALTTDTLDLNAKICEILGVEYKSESDNTDFGTVKRRKEKLQVLQEITDNQQILENVDAVAFDQDELFDILDKSTAVVFLYGEKFSIPYANSGITYIGVKYPTVFLENSEYDYNQNGIKLQNVHVEYSNEDAAISQLNHAEELMLSEKFKDAYPIIEKLAEYGNPRAMYHIAQYYSYGYNTVSIDENKRNDWLKKAERRNEPLSMIMFADIVLDKDSEEQKSRFKTCFEQLLLRSDVGDIFAQCQLGYMYDNGYGAEKDKEQAVRWYQKAADNGCTEAQNLLARMYYLGQGVSKNYEKAFEWFKKAAEKGHSTAQVNLGTMYRDGKGVRQDAVKAIEWFQKAIEQGEPVGKYCLAWMHEMGRGTAPNIEEAVKLYREAAYQGYAKAQSALGRMFETGKGVKQDYREAAEWYRKAAEQGDASAQCGLGRLYAAGKGVKNDYNEALEWYSKAAEQGDIQARKYLMNHRQRMLFFKHIGNYLFDLNV